jgi:hypothetical protein
MSRAARIPMATKTVFGSTRRVLWILRAFMLSVLAGASCSTSACEQADTENVARSIIVSEQIGLSLSKHHWKFRLTDDDTWEWSRFVGRDGWVVERSGRVDPITRVAFQRCLDEWRFESLPPAIGNYADDIDVPWVEVLTDGKQQRVDFLCPSRREFDERLPGRHIGGTVDDAKRFAGMWNELLGLIEGVIGEGQELDRSRVEF